MIEALGTGEGSGETLGFILSPLPSLLSGA